MRLSEKLRSEIFDFILKKENAFFFAAKDEEGFLPFLSEIWNLRSMPSEDNRFNNAYYDIFQHTVNNDDWDIDYLFKDRLKLLDDNDSFIRFLQVFLSPAYQQSTDSAFTYFVELNEILKKEKVSLVVTSYDDDDRPNFSIEELDQIDHPPDLPKNTIPFYVVKNPGFTRGKFHDFPSPGSEPCFSLIHDNWDDFGHRTSYFIHYHDSSRRVEIGIVKIATKSTNFTPSALPQNFIILDDQFCSLGQEFEYYLELDRLLGKKLGSVLYALKDCSYFSDIADEFDQTEVFNKSLIRFDEAERVYRQVKHRLKGFDLEQLYQFTYHFVPKYSEEPVKIDFLFNTIEPLPNRIYAVIGKNGTGKTQLITSLPMRIANGENSFFEPQVPIFSKVIAVSYSTFDSFEIPRKTTGFNYVYCGLRDENDNIRTERGQILKFHKTWKKIHSMGRIEKWYKILANFIENDLLDTFIKPDPHNDDNLHFDQSKFKQARSFLSSGQSITLYVISEIVANIRLDSLLLFDEPETHLHPNAITQLMNTIADLVHEFQSYCIIATHSPLLIQELFSRNVFVLERHGNAPLIRRIGLESFGENLSTLTEEVFGNRSIPKYYQQIIDELVKEFKEYDKVLEVMQRGNLPLSLNARLYLRSKTVEE